MNNLGDLQFTVQAKHHSIAEEENIAIGKRTMKKQNKGGGRSAIFDLNLRET